MRKFIDSVAPATQINSKLFPEQENIIVFKAQRESNGHNVFSNGNYTNSDWLINPNA